MKQKLTSVLLAILLTLPAAALLADEPVGDTQPQVQSTENHDSSHDEATGGGHHEVQGEDLPFWSVIPFVLILLSIALLPIVSHTTSHWWESNTNKLILALALAAVSFAILVLHGWFGKIVHTLVFEYVPFIILLGALFYISGGIRLKGDIEATPVNNTIFLIIGTFLASFIGTTGASMLLIRPILKTNSERKYVVHTVIFFIFLVSNIGGSLTPLGDPPLFLGYLIGVPFTWTFKLLPELLVAGILLLVTYFIWDSLAYKKETTKDLKKDQKHKHPISLEGQVNFIWLLGVVLSVAFINQNYIPQIAENPYLGFIREAVLIGLIVASKLTTRGHVREHNKFTLHPIQEVAYLFIGIFITMIPALILLEHHGKDLGVTETWQFFWVTGLFSGVLDNAPTYLTFLSLAKGTLGMSDVAQILADPHAESILKSISVGAVFMGALTYIGNAPNFMVKSVAEENNVKMPSFGGYVLYSFTILIPTFILLTFIFFR
ncbi:sodium:proton antiporter [Leptospira adleri]|uniref:Sodium:proton antiporter n=1 Tax=Leptospira adleri TaxID=2023186 RepID=A0A2M9YT30_9LEPT|nr:sodium:proton antiporter [Leptospira adleri]PJZ54674.1 sodium:proton antiporter [Leptospira adleri]PJZ60833.1 sodium:proton antiporter [Leptospira adleri]TGM57749.1 sodium:proton antiporter [Leptospira adleri]